MNVRPYEGATDVYLVRNETAQIQGELLSHNHRKHLCPCSSVPTCEALGLEQNCCPRFPTPSLPSCGPWR